MINQYSLDLKLKIVMMLISKISVKIRDIIKETIRDLSYFFLYLKGVVCPRIS